MGSCHVAFCIIAVLLLCTTLQASSSYTKIKPEIQRSITKSWESQPQPSKTFHPATIVVTKIGTQLNPIQESNNSVESDPTDKIEVCLDCISFMQRNLQILIVLITKIGVQSTCSKFCGQLNSTADIDLCNDICNVIGFKKFWNIFVNSGIVNNPIYACELVDSCDAVASPAVNITNSSITPASGPPGTTFEFKIQFTVVNETGVGETAFSVYYPTGISYALEFISVAIFPDYLPGEYTANLSFPTNSSFNSGSYLVLFEMCSGGCGQEPSTYPFSSTELAFNITQS